MRPEDAVGLMSDIRKRSDEQARQRLVEIALRSASHPRCGVCLGSAQRERHPDADACWKCDGTGLAPLNNPSAVRKRAGFKDPRKGHWCAAGLTAAMDDAGLIVPAPGTPARRGAVALLDWVRTEGVQVVSPVEARMWLHGRDTKPDAQPGDIIAWKQNQVPAEWLLTRECHAFAKTTSERSMCGKALRSAAVPAKLSERCSSCVWETRKGHVALIVKVDEESVTTVGWNEGPSPGRVMMRRLWRDPDKHCQCGGGGKVVHGDRVKTCPACKGTGRVPRSSTVLWRRPGGLHGVARPVAA